MPSDKDKQREEHEPVSDREEEDKVSRANTEDEDEEALKDEPGADLRLPPKEHHGKYVMFLYTFSGLVTFALMLAAACPVPWINSRWHTSTTLWKTNGTKWSDNPCDQRKQYMQMMQAFTIVSCVFGLIQFIVGLLQIFGVGHLGVTASVSFLTFYMTLLPWAMAIHLYHRKMCIHQGVFITGDRLTSGFALSFTSFGFQVMTAMALFYWFYTYFAIEEATKESFSHGAFSTLVLSVAATICGACGCVYTMWEAYTIDFTFKVTLWHLELHHSSLGLSQFLPIESYNCKQFKTYMNVGRAFAIIGAAFMFLTMLMNVGAVYKSFLKWAAVGLGFAAFIFSLISWAILLATRFHDFCNGSPRAAGYGLVPYPFNNGNEYAVNFTGYQITEGLGMIIASSCTILFSSIVLAIKG